MNDETRINRVNRFVNTLNQARELGLVAREAGEGYLVMELPYSDKIIGNPDTGVIHGGAITTLMDTTCGISTVCFLPDFEVCPTLDLRIDYMHPADPHKDILGFAECYRVTPTVIFTRGIAYQDDPEQPIAHAVGTFMRMGKSANLKTGVFPGGNKA